MKTKWKNFSRKYKARQKGLSSVIIGAVVIIIIYWFIWKKGIWNNIIRGLGFMEWEIPFLRSIYSVFFTAPVSMVLCLFLFSILFGGQYGFLVEERKKLLALLMSIMA